MKKSIKISLIFFVATAIANFSMAREKTTTSEGKQLEAISIEIIGEGKPIFYLPGFTVPGSIWKETVAKVVLDRKSYLFSYAGFNGNKPIKMPWYSRIRDSIIEYIETNNLDEIIIVGHSMGGNLAIDIASKLPNKISKIIVVDALPCIREVVMPNVPAESLFYESPYNKQMLEMNEQQFENMASMMASNMTLNEKRIDSLTKWIVEADRKTWVYGYTDLLKLDLRNVLSKIECETLILGAPFPNLEIAKENYESQYSNLAKKTIIIAPNSKHFIMFDQPKWFYETVNGFLINEKK